MSSQPHVSFCINGHLVDNVPEGCISFDDSEECPYCHEYFFHTVFNWHDREPETSLIPFEPIKREWVEIWNDEIRGKVRVPVFNVSKIKTWIDRRTNLKYDRSEIFQTSNTK
jgi:hypothetical protein